jgi:hypothetical protein
MAKISSYTNASPVKLSDKVIGTDTTHDNATKNFTVLSILGLIGDYYESVGTGTAGYVLTSNGAGLAPTWQAAGGGGYVPYTGATGDVNLGLYDLYADEIVVNGRLYFDVGADISFDGDEGTYGDVLMSNGTGVSPDWVTFASVFNSYKGSFYSSTTQTLTGGANVGIPVRLPITDVPLTNGLSIDLDGSGNPTLITADNNVDANFNFMFSAQLANSAGSSQVVDFWLRINGTDVPNSNGKVQLQSNNTFVMAAWNYFIRLNEADYVQLMWAATSTNVTMVADPINAVHPATPSIIVTLNQV